MTRHPGAIRRDLLLCLALVAGLAVLYGPAAGFEAISLDDPGYVENQLLTGGWKAETLGKTLLSAHENYWIPVTLASFMTDASLFGNDPGAYHRTNVILHIANACLLFLLLKIATGRPILSVLATALFAFHPLRVESVAWITERKDVLSTFFLLLAMLAYLRFARSRGLINILFVAALFALGLMSKPMLVTFPVLLLILDYWPLGRTGGDKGEQIIEPRQSLPGLKDLIIEKIPLFALSAAFAILTLFTQRTSLTSQIWKGPWTSQPEISLNPLAMAPTSYFIYLWKMVYPAGLTMEGIHTAISIRWWQGALAIAGLIGITALVWRGRSKRPYLVMGWLWYIVSLLPVSGLVPAGSQWISDRFTYIPSIGIAITLVWFMEDLLGRKRIAPYLAACVAVCCVFFLAFLSGRQLSPWRSSASLFRHYYDIDPSNPYVRGLMSSVLAREGHLRQAIDLMRENVREYPYDGQSVLNLARLLVNDGQLTEAIGHLRTLFSAFPEKEEVSFNLGVTLAQAGRLEEAMPPLESLYSRNPDFPDLRYNLAGILAQAGRTQDAIRILEEAVRKDSADFQALHNLGTLYFNDGNVSLAVANLEAALDHIPPGIAAGPTHFILGRALADAGDQSGTITHLREAVGLLPDDLPPRLALAEHLMRNPSRDEDDLVEAGSLLEEVVLRARDNGEGYYARGKLFELKGRLGEARQMYEKAAEAPFLLPETEILVDKALFTPPSGTT